MTLDVLLTLASLHAHRSPVARALLIDAKKHADAGQPLDAAQRAISSLRHSVGVFHLDYARAAAATIRLPPPTKGFHLPPS